MQLGLPFADELPPAVQLPPVEDLPPVVERPPKGLSRGEGTGGFRLRAEGSSFTVHFVRLRRARRYILRVRPDGSLRVTIPRGGSRAEALRFARRHLSWAERERARLLASRRPPAQWTVGTPILIDGEAVPIVRDGALACAGTIAVRVPIEQSNLRPAMERALREEASRTLPPRLLALAAQHGLNVTRVTIRNQRSRWGSCSRSARIALNFRLVQMPPHVREYILLHELMHLRHPDHSRRFWSAVLAVCPGFREAERWLKKNGQALF